MGSGKDATEGMGGGYAGMFLHLFACWRNCFFILWPSFADQPLSIKGFATCVPASLPHPAPTHSFSFVSGILPPEKSSLAAASGLAPGADSTPGSGEGSEAACRGQQALPHQQGLFLPQPSVPFCLLIISGGDCGGSPRPKREVAVSEQPS